MATTVHNLPGVGADHARPPAEPHSPLVLLLAPVALALVIWGALVARDLGDADTELIRAVLVTSWVVAGGVLVVRRPGERLGRLTLAAATLAAIGTLACAVVRSHEGGEAIDALPLGLAQLLRALAVALLPAAGMHVALALPDGTVDRRPLQRSVVAGYIVGALVGLVLWTQRPDLPLWPVYLEVVVALAVGLAGSNGRYRRTLGLERQRMQWLGWAVTLWGQLALLVLALRLLVDWPDHGWEVMAAATLSIPLALVFGATRKLIGNVDRLLSHTLSLAGLSGVVVGSYLVIVLGLGRVPTEDERALLLLSMVAAGVAALLYLPTRERLNRFSTRLVYGEREAPDAVLKTFGSRLSRAIPLDELLLQLAESLHKTLALAVSEVWTGGEGIVERSVSVPEQGPGRLSLNASEEPVVARAGVSGPAWARVWLPSLVPDGPEPVMRIAPITHSGHLLGLIVVRRRDEADQFDDEDDRVLTELARQVGLALHNVTLDSALQASLDEVRRQAEELRASRARVVASADAARRQIERNLHDGAQQHLVAMAVKLRLVRQLADVDADQAKTMLEDLRTDLQDAIQELRDLAHGIYPPLLMDRGLGEALTAAGGRAAIPTEVKAEGLGRYGQEAEAAVYFCCLEALQNAGKHAGEAASATVKVWEEEGALRFEVADNGAGFDPAEKGTGAGFVNMSDRLGAIGGTLRVESKPGQGTHISGTVPTATAAA